MSCRWTTLTPQQGDREAECHGRSDHEERGERAGGDGAGEVGRGPAVLAEPVRREGAREPRVGTAL